jgi:hypothetical protein
MTRRNKLFKSGKSGKIPQYISQPILRRTMRYSCTGAQSALAITPVTLLKSLGTVCKAANTDVTVLNESVRVLAVHLYCGTSASGTPATVTINLGAYGFNRNEEFVDTTINAAELASVHMRPPKNSLSSFWHTYASTDTLFVVTCPAGSIMDIDLEYIASDNDPSTRASGINSGSATLGVIYYINLSASATGFSPVALMTTW